MDERYLVDFEQPCAAKKFSPSLHSEGYAVLLNAPFDDSEISQLYDLWLNFFHRSLSYKKSFLRQSEARAGYIPASLCDVAKNYSLKDFKEEFHFHVNNTCPDNQLWISSRIRQKLMRISYVLLDWLYDALPEQKKCDLAKTLKEMSIDAPNTLFSMNYYPSLDDLGYQTNEDAFYSECRVDTNLMSMLPMAPTLNIERLTKDHAWEPIPYIKGGIIINSGDMLSMCTGGYYPTFYHRENNLEKYVYEHIALTFAIHPNKQTELVPNYTTENYLSDKHKDFLMQ